MNYIIDLFILGKNKDQYFLVSSLTTLTCVSAITGILLFFANTLPNKLPLFYSLPWGEKQLVTQSEFFILPGLLILISLVNFFLALQLHSLQIMLKRMLFLTALAIDLIVAISFFKIILIFI